MFANSAEREMTKSLEMEKSVCWILTVGNVGPVTHHSPSFGLSLTMPE